MALGHQSTSSSTTASSTSTGSASSSTSSSSSSSSGTASPPLILAFLAIALFICAAFFTIGMRRVRAETLTATRRQALQNAHLWAPSDQAPSPPKLWDVHTAPPEPSAPWQTLSPLSVMTYDDGPSPQKQFVAPTHRRVTLRSILRRNVRDTFRRTWPLHPPASRPRPPENAGADREMDTITHTDRRLRIMVAIAMPSQSQPQGMLDSPLRAAQANELSLGISDFPWSHEINDGAREAGKASEAS